MVQSNGHSYVFSVFYNPLFYNYIHVRILCFFYSYVFSFIRFKGALKGKRIRPFTVQSLRNRETEKIGINERFLLLSFFPLPVGSAFIFFYVFFFFRSVWLPFFPKYKNYPIFIDISLQMKFTNKTQYYLRKKKEKFELHPWTFGWVRLTSLDLKSRHLSPLTINTRWKTTTGSFVSGFDPTW